MIAQTSRIIVRRWTLEDAQATEHIYSDPENMHLFGAGATFTPAEVRASFVEVIAEYDRYGFGNYAVIDRATGSIIGHCGAHYVEERQWVEADWLIDRHFQGTGYGTEAAKAVFAYIHEVIKVDQIVAIAPIENAASIAIMRKLGMTFQEELIAHGRPSVRYAGTALTFRAATTGPATPRQDEFRNMTAPNDEQPPGGR